MILGYVLDAIQIALTVTVVGLVLYRFVPGRFKGSSRSNKDHPIISSADMLSAKGLQSMAVGKVHNYVYNLMTNQAGRVMMLITMDRNTYMHIIALGGKSGFESQLAYATSQTWLEPVQLEGNFPDDFRMYCTKDMQREVREIFAPDTMAHFQDLCKAYNFELFHDSIYISHAQGADDAEDSTTMVTDITHFIEENHRVLDRI